MKIGDIKKKIANLPSNAQIFIKINDKIIDINTINFTTKVQSDGSNFKEAYIIGKD